MASFISALALFILVLSNGCFTLPVHNETLFSPTEQNTFGLQVTFGNETNVFPTMNTEHSSTPFDTTLGSDKREFEDSFLSTTDMPEETNGKREFEDSFSTTDMPEETSSKLEFEDSFSTTDMPEETNGKREFEDSFSTTDMPEETNGKREFEDSFSTTDMPEETNGKREFEDSFSTTDMPEETNGRREFEDSFSTSTESTTYSVPPVDNGKREFNDDVLLTTAEVPTENNVAGETGSENVEREIQVESTTNDMLLFASTSSSVAPQLYTSEFSTSTGKYIGHLPLENDEDKEHEHKEEFEVEPEVSTKRPVKPKKVIKKVTPEPELESTEKVTFENEIEENSKESTPRTAIQDQKALDGVQSLYNFIMKLDENDTMVVTDIPKKFSKSPKQIETTEMPLNQGTESSHPEAEE